MDKIVENTLDNLISNNGDIIAIDTLIQVMVDYFNTTFNKQEYLVKINNYKTQSDKLKRNMLFRKKTTSEKLSKFLV